MSKTVTGENIWKGRKQEREKKEKGKGEKRGNSCHSGTTYGRKKTNQKKTLKKF